MKNHIHLTSYITKRIYSLVFLILFFSSTIFSQTQGKRLTIIHTNDLQSRLLGFAPNTDFTPLTTNDDATVGGIARVAHVIRNQKKKAPQRTLILDGGDWMMGTLFQTIGTFEGAELRLMQAIGYDATVIGNHEFDFKCDGLADIIESALSHGDIPQLLLSNGNFNPNDSGDNRLEALYNKGVIQPHLIIEKNGIRIGLFGLIGNQAVSVAPYTAPMTFEEPIESAKKMVKYLKEKEKAEIIICLTHSGVWHIDDQGTWGGEDVELARAVPEIDVVISGHSHTPIPDPIMINGTPIVQAGSEGQYVGVLEMQLQDNELKTINYDLIEVDDSFATENDINAMVDSFQLSIDEKTLEKYNISFTDILSETKFDLNIAQHDLLKSNLGMLSADAIRYGVQKYANDKTHPIVGFTTAGLIRDNILAGEKGLQQASDLFRVMPLGRGVIEDSPGYPLAIGYVTPTELKSILEVMLIAPVVKNYDSYFPYFSGVRFKYNPNRLPLDQIYEIELGDEQNGYTLLDLSSDQLIGVGANSYIYESIGLINEISQGLLTVEIKTVDGQPIKDVKDTYLDFSQTEEGIQEVKEWNSLIELTQSFPDINGNGYPDLPEYYRTAAVRQIKTPSWNPTILFKNASTVMWGGSGILIAVLGIVAWILRFIFRRRKKK